MLPYPFFPFIDSQSNLKASSDLLTIVVEGILTLYEALLLFNLHLPSDPSLKDNDTGTFGSLTIVPHDVNAKTESKIREKDI